jgi:hypothetical protein
MLAAQALDEGWGVRFAWRDADAWESDWAVDAANWVNGADLIFYSGHAYDNGWQLTDKDSGCPKVLESDTVDARDRQRRLWSTPFKWLIIGACGPLQDRCVFPGSGDAFNWVGAFNGLRLIAGFATVTSGLTGEGGRAFALARRGLPLARAWLRAIRETQPSAHQYQRFDANDGRWAAVLAIEGPSGSSLDDCLPGHGPELHEIDDPTSFRAIWSPA